MSQSLLKQMEALDLSLQQDERKSNSLSTREKNAESGFLPAGDPSSAPEDKHDKLQDPGTHNHEEIPQSKLAYVVQASATDSTEKIIGVFTNRARANRAALLHTSKNGITSSNIVDIISSFTFAEAKPKHPKATRRTWQDGTSEIRFTDGGGRLEWVKILPKLVNISPVKCLETVFLALDHDFVIGVFKTDDEAWQACKTYSAKLSYCSVLENEESFDDEGMRHMEGIISGTRHHWFVKRYRISKGAGSTSSG